VSVLDAVELVFDLIDLVRHWRFWGLLALGILAGWIVYEQAMLGDLSGIAALALGVVAGVGGLAWEWAS
jgi:hypothetical protein